MRTTINLDDGLLQRAKEHAARRGRTLTSLFEEALRRVLADAERGRTPGRVTLPTSTAGGGLRPGVDLDDSAALLDLLDDVSAGRPGNAAS